MNVAIAHEKLLSDGGAQRVAYELARTFDAPIYAGWVDDSVPPDDVDVRQLFSDRSRLALRGPPLTKDLFYMFRWNAVEPLYEYDAVLVNKPNISWYVPRDGQAIVHYAHHPPRWCYDRWHQTPTGVKNRVTSTVTRTLYQHTVNYPTRIVANSEITARRYRQYLDREVDNVVYPPVDTEALGDEICPTERELFITVGRVAQIKRVGEIVAAFEGRDELLYVVGDGPELDTLKADAPENVWFFGEVSERRKAELLSRAEAFIFNAEAEDFGMAPAEALASGTPVIGVREGFTQYMIESGVTGLLYDHGELGDALDTWRNWREEPDSVLSPPVAGTTDLEAFARKNFGVGRFRTEMENELGKALDTMTVVPGVRPPYDSEEAHL